MFDEASAYSSVCCLTCTHVCYIYMYRTLTKDLVTTLGIHIIATGSTTKLDKEWEPSKEDPYQWVRAQGMFKELESRYTYKYKCVLVRKTLFLLHWVQIRIDTLNIVIIHCCVI